MKEYLLRSRGDGSNPWGAKQIDRCISGLSNEVFQHHIDTENMSIDDLAEKIALMSDINLLSDKSGKLKKKLKRIITQLGHLRFFLNS